MILTCQYRILTCQYHILTRQYPIRTVRIGPYLHAFARFFVNALQSSKLLQFPGPGGITLTSYHALPPAIVNSATIYPGKEISLYRYSEGKIR